MSVSTTVLFNVHYKSRLVSILNDEFDASNMHVEQADNDGDVLIIETAIKQHSTRNTSIVVGEDFDL